MMAKLGDGQQLGQVKFLVDDLMEQLRCEASSNQECIQAFLSYINLHEKCKIKWDQNFKNANDIRLQQEDQIKVLTKERDGLQRALKLARRFFDEEKLLRKRAEDDRNSLEHQLQMISNLLQDNRNKLHDETREKLQYLSTMDQRLSTINESLYHDTTGSCLSDLSYSRSEDDLDIDSIRLSRRLRRSHGLVNDEAGINAKRRRSSSVLNTAKSEVVRAGPGECLVATTTVNIGDGRAPIASSVIETYPTTSTTSIIPPLKPVKPSAPQLSTDSGDSESEEFHRYPRSANKRKSNGSAVTAPFQSPTSGYFPLGGVSSSHLVSSRPHALINKTIIRPESCDPCGKKIKFGRIYCKCTECRTICHVECKDKLRLPCIPPGSGTPTTAKDSFGKIADYAPPTAPMVPAIVVHCINEIEKRGFKETGLYRLSASDKEVKALKEKFVKGRIVPNLSQVNDIHVVTGFLKDFFRSLQEPLVMYSHRPQFVEAARISDIDTRRAALYQVCSELPKPNRDTLAFLILHLLRVVEANECEMPVLNLARVFGPTVVGYSQPTHELIDMKMYSETDEAIEVMKELLLIPAEFWRNFVVSNTTSMLCTPSTGSLRDHHGFFDTPSSGWYTVRKKK